MTSAFIDFLYLDDVRIGEYLSRIDGGYSEEEMLRVRRELSGGGSAGVGIGGVRAEAGGGGSTNEESEMTVRQTAASRFGRFIEAWNEEAIEIDESTFQVFGKVKQRMPVSVTCDIEVPEIGRFLSTDVDIRGMFDIARSMGQVPDDFDPEMVEQIGAVQSFMGDKFVAVGDLHDNEPKMVLRLEKKYLKVDVTKPEGDVSVVAKVLRKLNESQTVPMIAFPGLDLLPREQRRSMSRQNQEEDESQQISGPAISLDVIAIYR